jgi:hypothetical protein
MLTPEVLQIEQTDCTMGNYQYIVTVEYPYEENAVVVVFNGNTEGHVFMQMESWPMHPVNNPKRYGSFDDHEWILNYFSAPLTAEANNE